MNIAQAAGQVTAVAGAAISSGTAAPVARWCIAPERRGNKYLPGDLRPPGPPRLGLIWRERNAPAFSFNVVGLRYVVYVLNFSKPVPSPFMLQSCS
jgi:hypothetical protein